jgi:uncharacterized protein (TIGR03382 family)
MSKFASAAVVVVAGVVAHHGPAAACSILTPTVQRMRFSVQDGDVVPRNLVLFSNFSGEADGSSWWLTSFGRAPEPLTMAFSAAERMVTLTPPEPLLPSTLYTLRWSETGAPPAGDANDDLDGDGQPEIATVSFTTSPSDDTTAPAAPTVAHETTSVFPEDTSCGFFGGGTRAHFSVTANDDDAVSMYLLRDVEGTVIDVSVVAYASLDDSGGFGLGEIADEGGTKAYQIVAIDHAGNESEPTVIDVGLGCPGSCSSADVTGVSALTGLLLLLRRRRHGPAREGVETER